jgi:hypothetical protein
MASKAYNHHPPSIPHSQIHQGEDDPATAFPLGLSSSFFSKLLKIAACNSSSSPSASLRALLGLPAAAPALNAFRTPLQNLQACVYLGITLTQLLNPVTSDELLPNPLSISIFSSLSPTCVPVGHSRFLTRMTQTYTSG